MKCALKQLKRLQQSCNKNAKKLCYNIFKSKSKQI
nr:MAG TPA: hypothetical protein [Caudoviricetes sp.]